MTEAVITDAGEREQARDPARSVIVQAPAGSGKTELLMQRYLALLEHVDEPEEILAVTFTRKAAAEMQTRILLALWPGENDERLAETAALADKVLQRNAERGWRLMEYPGRLRIRTLDAVNSWLTDSAPVSGDSTAMGVVNEQVDELYELAARQTLELVTEDSDLAQSIATVLGHLDNRADQFVRLMAQMLLRRDQWLPLLGSGDFDANARELLEASLRELVAHELEAASALLTDAVRAELGALLPYAAGHLAQTDPDATVCIWQDMAIFPTADPAALAHWQAVADFCLLQNVSKGPAFRKQVNKRNGFPTVKDGGDKATTDQASALLQELAGIEMLAEALDRVRSLPEPVYSDTQWEALQALIQVLPVVAAQLILVFRERGETDYIQIAVEALTALVDEDGPTGLALRLDCQINHILIDEFQDTSRTQFRLLENLTAGWTPDDGRTLFVVGDPMQSIYRFRQAEVALFLQLWEQGIGQLRLEQVRLSSNFRSDPEIVNWVNSTFAALMPGQNDPAIGAVRFAIGSAVKAAESGCGVKMHAFEEPARVDEARRIAELVASTLKDSDTETIGILVRTRHQARLIVPELRRRGIAFAGEGLEQPGETAVEQDLLALTRALCHQGDRTAWLAILRAPWCGLNLADLNLLCGSDWQRTVLEQIHDERLVGALSADGQARLERCRSSIDSILERRGNLPLRDWLEGAWQQLAGPAASRDERALTLTAQFFATLEQYDEGGNIAEAFMLHERLADRIDQQADSETRVHLLTLFKAKGLEYDTVILPALDGTTRQDEKAAIAWHEFSSQDGTTGYLLAPIEATGDDSDPLHGLIREFGKAQASHEYDRLLYVATTRAKKRLHLFFELKRNRDDELSAPRKGSLLRRLWPVIESDYAGFSGPVGTEEAREEWIQPRIRRFPSDWQAPAAPAELKFTRQDSGDSNEREVTFDWAGSDAMRLGSVVHRCLQYIAETGAMDWSDAGVIRRMLLEAGVSKVNIENTSAKVIAALQGALEDERGRWILADYAEAVCEYPVTVNNNGKPERLVIDRSFVDTDGIRWIVDYKTSSHEGGNLERFIDSEVERYARQMGRYRNAMQLLEPERIIRTALYFPLLGVFRELDAEPASDQIEPAS